MNKQHEGSTGTLNKGVYDAIYWACLEIVSSKEEDLLRERRGRLSDAIEEKLGFKFAQDFDNLLGELTVIYAEEMFRLAFEIGCDPAKALTLPDEKSRRWATADPT